MAAQTCETCKWWDRYPAQPTSGDCRRYAPRPSEYIADWVEVEITDWCGEYSRKMMEDDAP